MRNLTLELALTVMIEAVFFKLKLYFYQEKIPFNLKGEGLGKESSNKNIG